MTYLPAEIIKKKRNGFALTDEEIHFFIQESISERLPDYQMSALLMAIYFQGMNKNEQLTLTKEMLHSGKIIDLSFIPEFKVDKHSTGGVGDKTSLILGPIVAAAGLPVPMISGRGLGHTGGTLDKLESIPNFKVNLSVEKFKEGLIAHQLCFIGQTLDICPADKKIYALRDVTGTVESLPLICASIMSKKLAEGIDGLVLDVKFGSGAFMKTKEKAEELAQNLMSIGKGYGKKMAAVLSDMSQPLGRFAGNSLEIFECLEILKGKSFYNSTGLDLYQDTRELSLKLSALMIFLGKKASTLEEAYLICQQVLSSGKALQKFYDIITYQEGDIDSLPQAKKQLSLYSKKNAYVSRFETEKIGLCCVKINAGRKQSADLIEPTAGLEFHVKIGSQVKVGDPLFTIHGQDLSLLSSIQEELLSSIYFSEEPILDKETLIYKVIY